MNRPNNISLSEPFQSREKEEIEARMEYLANEIMPYVFNMYKLAGKAGEERTRTEDTNTKTSKCYDGAIIMKKVEFFVDNKPEGTLFYKLLPDKIRIEYQVK